MRYLVFLLSLIIALSAKAEKPHVVATASMIMDMAKNIGKEHVQVSCIVPIGGDPHIYKPTPKDAKLVVNANLIFKNALTFEGWLDELIENSGTKAAVVTVTKGVNTIKSETYNSPDPHAWMDVKNGIIYAENIKNALVTLVPAQKQAFEDNFAAYKKELEALDAYIVESVNSIPAEKRILVTSHDAFQYYGKRYGLQLESVQGISTDGDIQTKDVLHLQEVIKASKVPVVFVETTVNPKVLQQIAKDTGTSIGGKLLSDSLGDEKTGGDTYIKMLRHNTDLVVEGLKSEKVEAPSIEEENTATNYIFTGVIAFLFLAGIAFMFAKNKQ